MPPRRGVRAGDDDEFRRATAEIVDDERRAGHRAVAAVLERELDQNLRPGVEPPTLHPVPTARDDRPLLRITKPRYDAADLVLDPATRGLISQVARENRRRSELHDHGVRPRSRLLFVGPPGTGKSASAHTLAAELSVPVAQASLTAITSSFLGDTSRNLEAVVRFSQTTPCLLLLDEVDVLGQDRGRSDDHGELRRVAATLLQALEDEPGESVTVATSAPSVSPDDALYDELRARLEVLTEIEPEIES